MCMTEGVSFLSFSPSVYAIESTTQTNVISAFEMHIFVTNMYDGGSFVFTR